MIDVALVDAFDRFAMTAFRLETFPAYDVPEEAAALAAFQQGRPMEERSVRTSPWLARIAATTAAGKSWRRLRVVNDPPTLYERWEIDRYVESQACGEEVRLVTRRDFSDLHTDFWLFDAGQPTAVAYRMLYDDRGAFHGSEQASSEQLAEYKAVAERFWRAGVPLNTYLSRLQNAAAAS